MQVISGAGQASEPGRMGTRWVEDLRVADLSVGTYTIEPNRPDEQSPHTEDEIYVVVRGRARLEADGGSVDIEPGMVLYVPAHEAHRFTDVTEELVTLVVFAPPEGSRATAT